MRANVFTDKALRRYAGQFVWLSLDVEKAENAAYKKKYAADALPMFFVLDPKTEKAALRWVGGATVPQLQKILADGAAAVKGTGRSVETALDSLYQTKDYTGCAKTAADAFPRLSKTPSAANVAASGLSCALELPKEEASRAELVASLVQDSRAVLAAPRRDIAPDDISSVYETLASEREEAKDEASRKKILQDRASFLETAAARAKTPDARAVYDSHRLGTYLDLGEPERAIPMLQASERDLPGDYNPSARLAVAYRAMKKYDDAIAASDRALAKAYGPRKLGILQTRSDIYKEMGNLPEARKAMQQAVELAESLPEGQRSEKSIASLKKKLDTLSQ
jgi:tetratricopeptide (TPR) repeat protein